MSVVSAQPFCRRIEAEIEQLKKGKRDEDLKTVKELCKLHGFTAGMLKGALVPSRKPKSK